MVRPGPHRKNGSSVAEGMDTTRHRPRPRRLGNLGRITDTDTTRHRPRRRRLGNLGRISAIGASHSGHASAMALTRQDTDLAEEDWGILEGSVQLGRAIPGTRRESVLPGPCDFRRLILPNLGKTPPRGLCQPVGRLILPNLGKPPPRGLCNPVDLTQWISVSVRTGTLGLDNDTPQGSTGVATFRRRRFRN